MSTSPEVEIAVIGGGVVGTAVARALTCRGVSVALLEAEAELALGASGTNSGILHTGFDSRPGELETELILRAGAVREPVLASLGVPVIRCGALLRPRGAEDVETIEALAAGARRNHVDVRLCDDGALEVPGESVTDPVAFTRGLAAAARAGGADHAAADHRYLDLGRS